MGELDEYEEQNIAEGLAWLKSHTGECSHHQFWLKLHKKLFGDVWGWAGKVRTHELNNPYFHAPSQLWTAFKLLEDDVQYWLKGKTFPLKEIAARFHERIETLHPFANGNGRFGRILVEYFCEKKGETIPSWGSSFKDTPQNRRERYIHALDCARRNHDYTPLITFMFS